MSSNIAWVTAIFCPLLGVIISNARGLAPVRALLAARRNKDLGPLSPIPFALITNNCTGWTLYAILEGDYFIFFSNCFSMILGFVLCLTAVHILEHTDHKVNLKDKVLRLKVEGILISSAIFWLTIIFITCLVLRDPKYLTFNISLVGAFSDICALLFYAAPLACVANIIKIKNSAALYAPAIFANLISCILWFFYGLIGVDELIVWIPNGIGAIVCIFELFICWYYPPIFVKDSDGKIIEEYPTSDFAVYASGRHMSNAEVFPLLGLFSSKMGSDAGDSNPNASEFSQKEYMKSFKNTLTPIPEEKSFTRSRAATVSGTDYRDLEDNPLNSVNGSGSGSLKY